MTGILLTQSGGAILGPISKLFGYIMEFIYSILSSAFGIENIGITIIIFTIVIYSLMFPLTYKQQKYSKVSMKINPELQAIQKKYQGKTDDASRLKMNSETQALYDKYGISPMGSCLPVLIQFPFFIAMYNVIRNIPAYVSSVKDTYIEVVNGIMATSGYQDIITKLADQFNIVTEKKINFTGTETEAANSIIDVLYKFTSEGWAALCDKFPNLSDSILVLEASAEKFNDFIGLNIAYSPFQIIKNSFSSGEFLLLVLALLVPIISGLSQWVSLKISTSGQPKVDNPAMKQMQMMSMMMPLFSVVMVFSLPVGIGLYWIMGAVVRSVQQFFLNKHFDKMDFDAIVEKNKEKAAEKRAKREGYLQSAISENGRMNTRNISNAEKEELLNNANQARSNAKPGSMASKANLVRDYNEKNSTK